MLNATYETGTDPTPDPTPDPSHREELERLEDLDARLRAGGVAALVPNWPEAPFRVVATGEPSEPSESSSLSEPALLRGALLLGAQALDRDPAQLAGQLAGRLVAAREPGLRKLAEQARGWRGAVWLRPADASLAAPGGTLVATTTGAQHDATAVAVTTSGQTLTGFGDGTIRWRDRHGGPYTAVYQAHRRAVTALAVTPDGRVAVSGSADCMVRRWDLATGQSTVLGRMAEWVTAVAVTPDGGCALAGSADGRLSGWDLHKLRPLPVHRHHSEIVRALAISPDGTVAVSGGEDSRLVGWSLEINGDAVELAGGRNWVTSVAFLPGRRLLTGHADGTLTVRDAGGRPAILTLTGHTDAVDAVAVDGRLAVSASAGGMVRAWDLAAATDSGWGSGPRETVAVAAVTSGGASLTVGRHRQRPTLRHPERGTRVSWTPNAIYGEPKVVALARDGRLAVAGTHDSAIAVWDPTDRADPALLVGHTDAVTAVAVAPDGRTAVSGSADRTLRLWDLWRTVETGALLGHTGAITAVDISDDGRLVAYATADADVRLWQAGRAVTPTAHRWLYGEATAVGLASTRGGPVVVSGWREGAVRLWRAARDEVATLGAHDGQVTAVAVIPGGRLAATTGADHTVRVWDLTSDGSEGARELACFTGDWPMLACAFTPRRPHQPSLVVCDAAGTLHALELVEHPDVR